MIVVRMEFPNFVIEKVLLVLERFRSSNIFDEEVRERGRYQITIFRRQLNFGLRTIIDREYWSLIAG